MPIHAPQVRAARRESLAQSIEVLAARARSRKRAAAVPRWGPSEWIPRGDLLPEREFRCEKYGACLDSAAAAGWLGWTCAGCVRVDADD